MKYSVRDYAKALDRALAEPQSDGSAIGKHFLALVERNGDGPRLRKILDEASRLARGKKGVRQVRIDSARPLDAAGEAHVKKFLQPGDVVGYAVDPDLVAGVRIIVNDEMQFDGSLKAKLDQLFGN